MEKFNRAPSIDDLRARRDEILRITGARGVSNVYIIGSVARRESHPGSDIDFLVEMEPDRTVLDLSELILDLEEALQRPIDVVELRRGSQVLDNIRRDAVPL